jgi:hypothetical protein
VSNVIPLLLQLLCFSSHFDCDAIVPSLLLSLFYAMIILCADVALTGLLPGSKWVAEAAVTVRLTLHCVLKLSQSDVTNKIFLRKHGTLIAKHALA